MEGLPTIESAAAHESRLLSLSPDLLGAAGFDGLLKLRNPSWSTILGWSDEQLATRRFTELVAAAERADGQEFEFCLPHADGGERCILWSAQSSPDDGCYYLAGKDITERKYLENELAERAEKLERTNAELQDFAYIASHDLAEPLRMITSYLELLKRRYEGELDETADEFIGYAVGGAERMKALIDDLLAYSRVGSHDMRKVRFDLAELLAHVLEALHRAIEDAGADVRPATSLAPVCGDPTQIGQLMQNLVSNAVKFAAPDRPPVVTISTVAEDDGVRISVADNGIGIAEAQKERIFKMFARLHGRDEYEGTGIGLALCRRICERHGGRIWVESVAGEGSTFHVWLPEAR